MAVMVRWKESGALRRRLKEIRDDVHPASRKMDRFRTDVKKAIVADNINKLTRYGSQTYAGVDRYGKDLAKPAESTIRGWNVLGGFVLAPHGLSSRAITRFNVRWVFDGSAWRAITGWVGANWMIYHLEGRPKGSKASQPNWSLPKRDVAGITPKGWVEVRALFSKLAASIAKGK